MYKKHLKIFCILVFIPIIITSIVYARLPEEIIVRIGNSGSEYANKSSIWVLSIVTLVTAIILILGARYNNENGINKFSNCTVKQYGIVSFVSSLFITKGRER